MGEARQNTKRDLTEFAAPCYLFLRQRGMSKPLVPRRTVMLTIPFAPTGLCRLSLSAFGPTLSSLVAFVLMGLLLIGGSTLARAANILVVTGTDTAAIEAGNVLNGELTTAGNTVTVVNTGVPGSLAGFTQIYDTRYDNHPNFSAGEMSQYLAFLNAAPGNTIFLMGENVSFNVRNGPINTFIALAGGGTIAVPARTVNGPETVVPPFTGPNVISTITYAACGLVTSAGTGAFASYETGGGCAIFFNQGTLANALAGALVVVYDVNFIATAPTGSAINEIPFRKNLEQYVSAPPTGPPPTLVTGLSPATGPSTGGTVVTIAGIDLTGATAVNFGGASAASFLVTSSTSITATSPPEAVGTYDVTVIAPGGTSLISAADRFTVTAVTPVVTGISPATGPTTGGTVVTITGTGFLGATAVRFGGFAAASFTVNSNTSITAVSPGEAVGAVDVAVTTLGGTSSASAADKFAFALPSAVSTPTLSEWSMLALGLLLCSVACLRLRKAGERNVEA
jgi:hypothetical protein